MGATSAGTKHYFQSRALGLSPSTFGKTGWTVSPVGFGCYRIEGGVPEQDQALRDAFLGGCNLVDTSTNYGDGESERTVGRVLRELISQGHLLREEVVIVSKAGYVQGKNYVQAQNRENEGRACPEMVKLRPGLWHCLHPEFLKVQLDESLERLGLETLDVLLLHNPEYYLKSSGAQPAEYYRRIQAALEYLETERKAGRIQAFGISSNTFGEPKDSNEFTSLEVILETAPPGFQVIQFPFNLLEPGAVFEPNNSGKTLVELAFERELATLVNRPLNAFWNNRLVRLADFEEKNPIEAEDAVKEAFAEALAIETRYPGEALVPAQKAAWAHIIRHHFESLADIMEWRPFREYQLRPSLSELHSVLSDSENATPETIAWSREHHRALEKLGDALDTWLSGQAGERSRRIARTLRKAAPALDLPEGRTGLANQALRIYLSVPGIHGILVGMRHPQYVSSVLKGLRPPIPTEQAAAAFDALADLAAETPSPSGETK